MPQRRCSFASRLLGPAGIAAISSQVLSSVCSPQAASAAATTIPLVAHRAVYELSLTKATGAKSPASAHGRIAFDFTGSACDGYVMTFRQMTELQPTDGPERVSDMRSTTFEDGRGKDFSFKVQTLVDSSGPEDLDGHARKSADGAVSVDLTRPKTAKFDLDRGILFPTEHLKRIVAAAKAGQNVLEVKVYDGSDTGEKVYDTLTVIGHETESMPDEKAAQLDALKSVARWPVAISYFEEGKKDGPNYVLSFDLYENGISRALKLDYGDFVLTGEMTKLELLPQKASCEE